MRASHERREGVLSTAGPPSSHFCQLLHRLFQNHGIFQDSKIPQRKERRQIGKRPTQRVFIRFVTSSSLDPVLFPPESHLRYLSFSGPVGGLSRGVPCLVVLCTSIERVCTWFRAPPTRCVEMRPLCGMKPLFRRCEGPTHPCAQPRSSSWTPGVLLTFCYDERR